MVSTRSGGVKKGEISLIYKILPGMMVAKVKLKLYSISKKRFVCMKGFLLGNSI